MVYRATIQSDNMKVLLIFPPMTMKERYSKKVGNVGGHLAPLGIAYMAAVLEKAGHKVSILDAPAMGMTSDNVLEEIEKTNPKFIGISAITSTIHRVVEISRKIKEKYPNIILGIGGPHVTIFPEKTLKDTQANFVMTGEGEVSIIDALKNIKKLDGKRIIHGKPVNDLDSVPFPARHLLPMDKYTSLPNNYIRSPHVINMITSRGCPYRCTYCCKAIYGMRYRQRSVRNTIEEIKKVIKDYGAQEIAFWDDIFTIRRDWVLNFCKELKRRRIDIACHVIPELT